MEMQDYPDIGGFCSFRNVTGLGLRESSFLLLEYSIEYLIEYSSTRWIPEVAMGSMKISRRNPCSPFFSVSYSINRHKII